jgi:ABC-type Fe3+-hydroxamate transport system substrate-binding protein
MDGKLMAIGIAAIVVVAGIGVVVGINIGGNDKKNADDNVAYGSDTVVIYGNANNDSFINDDDLQFVKDIVDKKTAWDRSKNPFADADCNGEITQADVDKIQMIINKESGKIFYKNYFGEDQEISFPLVNKKIAVTYWQQAEAVAILGQWSNVKVANAYVTQIKNNQYPCEGIVEVGTTGSSAKSVDDNGVSEMIKAKIDLIIATPTTAVKTGCDKVIVDGVKADAIYLWHMGNSSIPTILTMGIMFNQEEQAQKYAKFCYDLIDKVEGKLSGVEKKDIIVTTMYANQATRPDITVCSGVGREGTCTVLQHLGNVYNNWNGINDFGMASYQKEWFVGDGDKFDVIFMAYSSVDQFTYTQDKFNESFEDFITYFKNTKAYNNNGMIGAPYIFAGYSMFSMMMYAAWMIYPDLFSLEEAQDSLQEWFDTFTVAKVDVKKDAVCYYTGTAYKTLYAES